MEFENLLEIVKKRRTIRKYMPEPIPDDYIDNVIDAARWAPSGANTQPWEFVIVKDPEVKKQMGLTVSGAVARGNEGKVPPQPYFEGAPVLIVVCGDPRLMEACPKGEIREELFISSMGASIQNMLLAATALGLEGSVWGTVGPLAGVRIKDMLNIPQVFKVSAIVPLGYPALHPSPTFRREIDEISHAEKYDMSKFRTDKDIQEFIESKTMKGLNKMRLL
jgi:nitroreductase